MTGLACKCVVGFAFVVAACASSPKPPAASAPAPAAASAAAPPASAPTAGGQEALAAIREVEAEPFREDDAYVAKRAALIKWVIDAPDLTVVLCGDMMPDFKGEDPVDAVLLAQLMVAQAAYLIEHPGAPPKDEAVLTSGLVGAIRAYRKLLVIHPDQRRPAWDQLDTARTKQRPFVPRQKRDEGVAKP